jgi:hypothetical protein
MAQSTYNQDTVKRELFAAVKIDYGDVRRVSNDGIVFSCRVHMPPNMRAMMWQWRTDLGDTPMYLPQGIWIDDGDTFTVPTNFPLHPDAYHEGQAYMGDSNETFKGGDYVFGYYAFNAGQDPDSAVRIKDFYHTIAPPNDLTALYDVEADYNAPVVCTKGDGTTVTLTNAEFQKQLAELNGKVANLWHYFDEINLWATTTGDEETSEVSLGYDYSGHELFARGLNWRDTSLALTAGFHRYRLGTHAYPQPLTFDGMCFLPDTGGYSKTIFSNPPNYGAPNGRIEVGQEPGMNPGTWDIGFYIYIDTPVAAYDNLPTYRAVFTYRKS